MATIHDLAGLITFSSLTAASFVMARSFAGNPSWKGWTFIPLSPGSCGDLLRGLSSRVCPRPERRPFRLANRSAPTHLDHCRLELGCAAGSMTLCEGRSHHHARFAEDREQPVPVAL